MTINVQLREITEADLPTIFEQQLDPTANYMAAFISRIPADRDAFNEHWKKILANDAIIKRVILCDGRIVGNVACFEWEGKLEVSYWIGREYWGKGIATKALSLLIELINTRPLYAYAATDNKGSIRVLEKCGFTHYGYHKEYSNARDEDVEQVIYILQADSQTNRQP
ncbi:MAG: GNAT family N-acetyltransferase [Chloroflexota bacterium]